jgi:hypothetical protein
MAPHKRGPTPRKGPDGSVVQRGRFIYVRGLAKPWKPAQADLAGFDPDMRVSTVPASSPGASRTMRTAGGLVISFPTATKAKAAFDKLFGDCALGLADAMPDDTHWIGTDMRTAARAMSRLN